MTPKQKAAIKYNLKQKYLKGELAKYEFDDLVDKLQAMEAQGYTLQEANQALGLSKKSGTAVSKSKAVDTPMSLAEKAQIASELLQKYKQGGLTVDELYDLDDKLEVLYNDQKSVLEAKHELGIINDKQYKAQKGKTAPAAAATPAAGGNPDPAQQAADEAVSKLEKQLKKVYNTAEKEMQQKLKEFIDKYGDKLAEKQQMVADGQMTQAALDTWIDDQGKMIDLLNAKIDQMSTSMFHANQMAASMINGEVFGVFAEAANFQSYQITQDAGINLNFAIYDESTVKRLVRETPELLPRKMVDGKKDKAWNKRQIAGAVTQAVIQGESIPKLAARIAKDTASKNGKAMIRYARTAMTSAQNAGRMDTLHRAQGLGIQCKKVWLATLDSRTRDSHQQMDGVSVGIDEKFVTPLGSKMDYPGDMVGGKPGDIWNCRCTMIYQYEGFPDDPEFDQRLAYDEYTTTETDAKGKEHKVKHRESQIIQNMDYKTWAAAKAGSMLNDLNVAKVELAKSQKEMIKNKVKEDQIFEGIWKDPVTLAQYPDKKGSIQAKRDYYIAEIDKVKQAMASGYSWATQDKLDDLQAKADLLDQFEQNGKLLEKRNQALKKVQDIYDKVGLQQQAEVPGVSITPQKAAAKKSGQFAPDAWDEQTRKKARNFRDKRTADKTLRPELDAMWDTLTDVEKYAVWEYTRNSHPMNQPLSGFNDRWGRVGTSNFVGLDKTHWGHQDNYSNRNFYDAPDMEKFSKSNGHPSYHKAITECTKAIEKSRLKKGIWLVRGSDEEGLAGLWESGGTGGLDFDSVMELLTGRHSIDEVKRALVGQTGQNHAFTSTGVATGTGFSGAVRYNIYAPEGTKGIYAEPQSYWGLTTKRRIYQTGDPSSGVSNEAEIIIQRGTRYRVIDVRGRPGNWEIDMEVVEQPDYFAEGDENTYNDGKTRQRD